MASKKTIDFSKVPKVDLLLTKPTIRKIEKRWGKPLLIFCIRETLTRYRQSLAAGGKPQEIKAIINEISFAADSLTEAGLKKVINATGVALNTNLGRAPLGREILDTVFKSVSGYSNLEFNLQTGRRGSRTTHFRDLLRLVTGAEDGLAVNNNAAALILVLNVLAKGREVIVSRGELIEIGGSFRIPDILKTAGVKMVEVGSTNKTRLSDYENALTEKTRLILKAHPSNFRISGFTESVPLKQLVQLGNRKGVPILYDVGSGLVDRIKGLPLGDEPTVKGSLKDGADLVAFSGDKLLGGPQCGIIGGKSEWVKKLAKAPMMRALRLGKLDLAVLVETLRRYLGHEGEIPDVPVLRLLGQKPATLKKRANGLAQKIGAFYKKINVTKTKAQVGGGTLPEHFLKSYGVVFEFSGDSATLKSHAAEALYQGLLEPPYPLVGILKEGRLVLDVFSISDGEIDPAAAQVLTRLKKLGYD